MTTKTRTVDELRREHQEADRRVRELAVEARDLPARIQEAAREDAKAKAQAARAGEDVATVTVSDPPRLREREASLPLELWGARIGRLEASLELQRAELEEVSRAAGEARQEHEAAEQRLKEARGQYDEARNRHWSLGSRGQQLQRQLRDGQRELAALESQGPPSV